MRFLYFLIYRKPRPPLGGVDDVEDCRACKNNCEALFWARQRYNNDRFAVYMQGLAAGELDGLTGDEREEFQPSIPSTVFQISKKKKQVIHYMTEVGDRAVHTCHFGTMLTETFQQPFWEKGDGRVCEGGKGFLVELAFVIRGVVDQNPPSRWVHFAHKSFTINFPSAFHCILGRRMFVEGDFAIMGEKFSRMKRMKVGFIEKDRVSMFQNVPPNTEVIINWTENLYAAPYRGLLWWGVEVELRRWSKVD